MGEYLCLVAIVVTLSIFYPLYFKVMGGNVLKATYQPRRQGHFEIIKQVLPFREYVLTTYFCGKANGFNSRCYPVVQINGKNMCIWIHTYTNLCIVIRLVVVELVCQENHWNVFKNYFNQGTFQWLYYTLAETGIIITRKLGNISCLSGSY